MECRIEFIWGMGYERIPTLKSMSQNSEVENLGVFPFVLL